MTKNIFSAMTDENLRNAAVYFYGMPVGGVSESLFTEFESVLAERLREMSLPDAEIPPEDALFYYDILNLAADNGGDAVAQAAAAAEENVTAALEKEIVPDEDDLTDEDFERNETDLFVYSRDDPFERNADGTFVHPEFAALDRGIGGIRLADDDGEETSPEEAKQEICDTLKMTACARVCSFLMNSREKIDEDDYFAMLYEQMVWDLIGLFSTEEDADEDEIDRNVSRVLKECGWNK